MIEWDSLSSPANHNPLDILFQKITILHNLSSLWNRLINVEGGLLLKSSSASNTHARAMIKRNYNDTCIMNVETWGRQRQLDRWRPSRREQRPQLALFQDRLPRLGYEISQQPLCATSLFSPVKEKLEGKACVNIQKRKIIPSCELNLVLYLRGSGQRFWVECCDPGDWDQNESILVLVNLNAIKMSKITIKH